jgi:hypothetical protein
VQKRFCKYRIFQILKIWRLFGVGVKGDFYSPIPHNPQLIAYLHIKHTAKLSGALGSVE